MSQTRKNSAMSDEVISNQTKLDQAGSNQLITIGWKERVALPDWGIGRLLVKVDTGACVSAIHVAEVEELPDGRVRFDVALRRDTTRTRTVEADVIRVARIKPSTGRPQERYVVKTTVRIGNHDFETELSLVCRQKMRCRMLLGRKALSGLFTVDTARTFVHGEPVRRKTKRSKSESS